LGLKRGVDVEEKKLGISAAAGYIKRFLTTVEMTISTLSSLKGVEVWAALPPIPHTPPKKWTLSFRGVARNLNF
jgi:hypothetical protein